MANVNCVIVNPTDAEFTNVNAGGADVAARSVSGVLVLSDAEVAAFAAAHDDDAVILIANASTGAINGERRRLAAKLLKLGKNPGEATS